MKKKNNLIILSLFFVAFLIRVVGISNVPIYGGDELLYWTDTNKILASNFAPRTDVFDYMTPFLPYIQAVITSLFGGDLNTLRMTSVIFGSLDVPMLYLFGKAMYDRKTGLLSALFLCFSAYHCLFSRIYMLEAFTLFFIIAFLYFFWLSWCSEQEKKGMTYAIIAGAMMGLAFDAKYLSFFLVPAVLAYVLWTKRFKLKALTDKRIILVFIFAFLFFLPLLICLFYTGVGFHGFSFYATERYEKERTTGTRPYEFSPDELLIRGGGQILEVLTWGANAEILICSWAYLFKLSAILILLTTLFFYSRDFINLEKRSCFLIISLFMLFILLLNTGNTRHYLIYLFPFFYVMFSHLATKSFEYLRRENSYKNIFRILIILLTVIMVSFTIVTAVTSSYWDKGGYNPWLESAVDYIKSDITKNGYKEEHVLIGTVMVTNKMVNYQLFLSEINISTINLLKPGSKYSGELATINLEKVNVLKPSYIIVSEPHYEEYFKENVEREIFKDYKIVFHSQNYPHGCLVLKRKNIQPPELLSLVDSKNGKITQDVFKRSVPSVMKVGKVYTALVQVKNTGDARTNFPIFVDYDSYTMFVEEDWFNVTLDKDSTRTLKFKIVPIREYSGKLPITVNLYTKPEGYETLRENVDSVTDYVYRIEK